FPSTTLFRSWSPDSKTVYVSAETRGNIHVFAAPATGGSVRQITTGERQLGGPAITRDGKWLAYSASDATHPAELFVAPLGRAGPGPDKRLTSFNDSLLAQLVTIPADTFWFTSVGGLAIEAFVMRPYGYRSGKLPLDPVHSRRPALELRQRVLPRDAAARGTGVLGTARQSARFERVRARLHVRDARAVGDGRLPGPDESG